ncbi:hypothetical protein [Leptolyngbya sp. FACHB-321]|uniref:hypothetical protein n=1 Tax=Leptolyngbya sp. FACHB-321 TaxID=2692807 RepID=UPI00321F995F
MTSCPCCSGPLLRHIRCQEKYWFCRHCWQEMPVLEESILLTAVNLNNVSLNNVSLKSPSKRELVTA